MRTHPVSNIFAGPLILARVRAPSGELAGISEAGLVGRKRQLRAFTYIRLHLVSIGPSVPIFRQYRPLFCPELTNLSVNSAKSVFCGMGHDLARILRICRDIGQVSRPLARIRPLSGDLGQLCRRPMAPGCNPARAGSLPPPRAISSASDQPAASERKNQRPMWGVCGGPLGGAD